MANLHFQRRKLKIGLLKNFNRRGRGGLARQGDVILWQLREIEIIGNKSTFFVEIKDMSS
jgi:hypothetical protein